jgi:hypothetical protein
MCLTQCLFWRVGKYLEHSSATYAYNVHGVHGCIHNDLDVHMGSSRFKSRCFPQFSYTTRDNNSKSRLPVSYKFFQTHQHTIDVTQSDKLTRNFNQQHRKY